MSALRTPPIWPEKSPSRASAQTLYHVLLDALFPPRCAGCPNWSRASFCPDCASQLRPISAPLCELCGAPFDPLAFSAPTCAACRARAPHFRAARSVWHFDTPLRHAIHRFKYGQKSALASRLAPHLSQKMKDDPVLRDFAPRFIVPVPLHRARLRQRGFNQSLLLAQELGRLLGLETRELLSRTRDTPPQVDLGRDERAKNMRDAFAIETKSRAAKSRAAKSGEVKSGEVKSEWQGARILLIDDVFTTGATLGEAAKTLKRAGAGEVCALTLGRQA